MIADDIDFSRNFHFHRYMEFILDLIGDGLPSQVLCILILFIIALKDVKLHQGLKVGILYLVSFVMIFMGLVETCVGVGFLLLAEFALLEIFTDDVEKRSLLGVGYKILDCVYKLFVEYYFALYLGSIAVLAVGESMIRECNSLFAQDGILCWLYDWQDTFAVWVVLLTSVLIIAAILCITRMKFETKTITEIMDVLRAVDIYSVPVNDMETKFGMLVAFEDKTFLDRDKGSHTVLSPLIMKGVFKYVNKTALRRPFRTVCKIFSRGYGTIEMQLMRNIGIERGYDTCVLRRKVFEVIYSTIVFNCYRKQFSEDSDSVRDYKYWMLWCYIQKVPVKFSRRFFPAKLSTAQQVFGKDFEVLSLEEFFVWCISLEFFALIGPKTVMKRESIMVEYGLDQSKIEAALKRAYKVR